ncbi:hypothetical protein C8R46DRAFT_1078057 [Mycena filopes]|nr:hypothetical protein C8R46DRAFT_1078057 [Mycena filopes]
MSSLRKHKYTGLHGGLSLEVFKSAVVDIIQSHYRYNELTSRSVYGGSSHSSLIRVNRLQPAGVLLDLDYPPEPVLLTSAATARKKIPVLSNSDVPQDLSFSIDKFYGIAREKATVDLEPSLRSIIWNPPGPFKPRFSSIADSLLIPLWRLLGDTLFFSHRPVSRTTDDASMLYAKAMQLITKAVGCEELVLRTALRVPLPPAQPDELVVTTAFDALIHIETASEFKRAIVDIAKAITQFGQAYPRVGLATVTPDCLLFQQNRGGFLLDLDPLEESSSLITYGGADQGQPSLRFGPYDLISAPSAPPTNNSYPRHALESLFYSLVWFTSQTTMLREPRPAGYDVPRQEFYDPAASNLPHDRTAYRYPLFVEQRQMFLADWRVYLAFMPNSVGLPQSDKNPFRKSWLLAVWALIGEAHLFARWREEEPGYDWETLGGNFTPERFMAALLV